MAGITLGMKAAAKAGGDGAADQIARLLREGRAAEVTDEMLGALGPNDQARLFDLYESGATGMDLPMDEASRAGRAKAQGFDVDAFHASGASEPFARFRPGSRGSTYFAATPNRAQVGAAGGAQDLAHLSAGPTERAPQSIMPMRLRGDDVGNFRPPRDVWDALPEVVTEDQAQQLAQQAGGNYWWDVFDERQIKAPRWDANDNLIDPGQFEYVRKPYPAQEYTARSGDWRESARMLPGYNTGDDLRSLDYVRRQGQRGFMVSDEAGASIVMDPSAPIRSRHARFDPRLSKNADLLASRAPVPGAGGVMATRPTSPAEPSGDGPSLSDVLGRLKQAFGLAGRAGIEGMNTALSGVDEQGRSVGSILPFAKDERTGEVGLASPRILDLWNTAGGVVPAKGVTLGAGPVMRAGKRAEQVTEQVTEQVGRRSAPVTEQVAPAAAQKARKIKDLKGRTREAPREFYRGTNPGSTERIRTGKDEWDSHLFAADNERDARLYGSDIETIKAKPEAKILYEGTREWQQIAGKWRNSENMLEYADRAAKAARAAGYDAAWFKRQSDIGTAIFNPDAFLRGNADLLASRAAPGSLGIGGDRRLTYRDLEDWL